MRKMIVKFRPRLNVWVVKQAGKVVLKGTEAECRAFEVKGTDRAKDDARWAHAPVNAGLERLSHAMIENAVGWEYTPLQFAAIHFIANEAGNGATTLEAMVEDNMTWFSHKDLVQGLGLSKEGVASLMRHLEENGLAQDMERGAQVRYDRADWCLTDKGLKAVDWDLIQAL